LISAAGCHRLKVGASKNLPTNIRNWHGCWRQPPQAQNLLLPQACRWSPPRIKVLWCWCWTSCPAHIHFQAHSALKCPKKANIKCVGICRTWFSTVEWVFIAHAQSWVVEYINRSLTKWLAILCTCLKLSPSVRTPFVFLWWACTNISFH
jgi:hypothetical protein